MRTVQSNYRPNHHKIRAVDGLEIADQGVFMLQQMAEQRGGPVDEEALAKAYDNSKKITPTSPHWCGLQPNMDKEQTNGDWKPPYFQDTEEE